MSIGLQYFVSRLQDGGSGPVMLYPSNKDTHVGGFEGVPLTADAAGDTEAQAGVFLYPHTQLLLEAVGALLALRLQKTASALGSWVGVGRHNNLITVDHALVAVDDVLVAVGDALVAVVLRVGGGLVRGERRLVS